MPAFRNSGLEGTSSFAHQNWLLAVHRRTNYLAKKDGLKTTSFATKKGNDCPSKQVTFPKRWASRLSAHLLSYYHSKKPEMYGGSETSGTLIKHGMIEMVRDPTHPCAAQPYLGAEFVITEKGKQLVERLLSKT